MARIPGRHAELVDAFFQIGQQLHMLTDYALSSAVARNERQLAEQLADIERIQEDNESMRRRLHAFVQQVSSSFRLLSS
ncbi:hypothetical protein BC831DRAFT_460483 [Entophlyctis helioformis]|nr:hypothetical protein BC831DRAFT_460483 [Entophlyctis helioformis]